MITHVSHFYLVEAPKKKAGKDLLVGTYRRYEVDTYTYYLSV